VDAALTYAKAADKAWRAGEPRDAERYLTLANKAASTLGQDSPDAAFRKHELFDAIADTYVANSHPAEARAAYVMSARTLDTYLTTFRQARWESSRAAFGTRRAIAATSRFTSSDRDPLPGSRSCFRRSTRCSSAAGQSAIREGVRSDLEAVRPRARGAGSPLVRSDARPPTCSNRQLLSLPGTEDRT
jgi:hypothetical protein